MEVRPFLRAHVMSCANSEAGMGGELKDLFY